MPLPALLIPALIAGGTAVAGIAGAYFQSEATKDAAETQSGAAREAAGIQSEAAQAGIAEQQRQFNAVQELLNPFVEAGNTALQQQQALSGSLGQEAQQQAISGIEGSSQFTAMQQQGENAILQNASATGGLRGGNVQGALGQFRPQLLNELVNQRFGQLSGLSQMGQASAAGVGAAGQSTGANIANLLGQSGQAQAQGMLGAGSAAAQQQLASGQFAASIPGSIAGGLGVFTGLGGFSGGVNPTGEIL